jgi:hypothetical protein
MSRFLGTLLRYFLPDFGMVPVVSIVNWYHCCFYEGRSESKERFSIKKYLLIIGKKKNMQVLSHTFTYFST